MLRSLVYTPSGRAGEYVNKGYAANLYKGCTHGCKYCYVPRFLRMGKAQECEFRSKVVPVPDMVDRLNRDMKRLGQLDEPIFLCFTCDPYPESRELNRNTSLAIEAILASGNAVNILSKAGRRATHDFDLLRCDKHNKVGATLTFIDNALSLEWEPNAPFPWLRLEMLALAKEYGIQTWASIEPVIIPDQSLAIMNAAAQHVDEFKIGKWNHDPRAKDIDWKKFTLDAVKLMRKLGKKYILKSDLIDAARGI